MNFVGAQRGVQFNPNRAPRRGERIHQTQRRVKRGRAQNLPWMSAVLNKTLRFRAPATGGIRLALEDVSLKDGTIVPKGACFMSYFAAIKD